MCVLHDDSKWERKNQPPTRNRQVTTLAMGSPRPGARPAVPEGQEGIWKGTHKHMLPSLEIHDFTQALVSSSKCGVTLVCLLLLVCGCFDISFLDLHKKFLSDLETDTSMFHFLFS